MAGSVVSTGKKTYKFGLSSGTLQSDGSNKEIWQAGNFNPGKKGPKRRKSKDHKVRTGKAAQRKATHHYGSFAKG